MVRFDLGPLLQGQIRVAKFKCAYKSLFIGPRDLECQTMIALNLKCYFNCSLALVNYLFSGYNLHQFSDALSLVIMLG